LTPHVAALALQALKLCSLIP